MTDAGPTPGSNSNSNLESNSNSDPDPTPEPRPDSTSRSGSASDPVLAARGLSKAFGTETAVDDVSLSLASGEFFALLGPSGCGKTTTLRLLAGLESPTRGRVLLDGVDVTDRPANRRDVGLVFQSLVLFPHMSVAENVAYGLARAGVGREEREERVAAMLDLVGLGGFGDRDPASLSGGQRQRVALARSLVTEPRVLLLDEPLSSLDRGLREELQTELTRIQREVGTTFLYVTHDQESAMTMADRVAVMADGRLVETGPPERLYREPETAFVARFFGDAAVVGGVAGDGVVRIAGVPVSAERTGGCRPGDRVAVVVHPDDVALQEAAALSGTVESVAYRGGHYEHAVAVEGGGDTVADGSDRTGGDDGDRLVLRAWTAEARTVGERVGVAVDRARVVDRRARHDPAEGRA
jgi:spermidine/putrescine transport system ATP-binding protein